MWNWNRPEYPNNFDTFALNSYTSYQNYKDNLILIGTMSFHVLRWLAIASTIKYDRISKCSEVHFLLLSYLLLWLASPVFLSNNFKTIVCENYFQSSEYFPSSIPAFWGSKLPWKICNPWRRNLGTWQKNHCVTIVYCNIGLPCRTKCFPTTHEKKCGYLIKFFYWDHRDTTISQWLLALGCFGGDVVNQKRRKS